MSEVSGLRILGFLGFNVLGLELGDFMLTVESCRGAQNQAGTLHPKQSESLTRKLTLQLEPCPSCILHMIN